MKLTQLLVTIAQAKDSQMLLSEKGQRSTPTCVTKIQVYFISHPKFIISGLFV